MSYPPSRYAKKVIHLPSGDQTGWRASLKRSVMRFAWPPVDGSVQMLPCRSMASVPPSGDTPTDMEVPSLTVTVIAAAADGLGPCAAPSRATEPKTAIKVLVRFMVFPRDGWHRILYGCGGAV